MDSSMKQRLVQLRREFHAHAETGWTEFWTTAKIAGILKNLGYQVSVGKEILDLESVMGRPSEDEMAKYIERAVHQGADPEWIKRMDGYTGAVAVLDTGKKGPTLAFRFDIDAVDVAEAAEENHRPFREGFASMNENAMHSCGHDAHTVIGLGFAELLMRRKEELKGVFKLIFQPAEEGVRGGKAVAMKGILDDVDYFLGAHIGMGIPTGNVAPGCGDFLCTTKFDAVYKGKAAHAGGAPNEGKNALLAAASATLALAGISPHKDGATRLNVGVLHAGTGRNVVPSKAVMKVETRGLTTALNEYVYGRAMEIVEGAAVMYGVELSVAKMGEAVDAFSDKELVDLVAEKALSVPGIEKLAPSVSLGGSEDVSWMMRAVQQHGGKAVYFVLGSDIAAGHHNEFFDVDERVLSYGAALFADLAFALSER
ncbi:MAG: M20 family metallo-hydrolase [Synergistaceae bacterium]|nr:M20 family metallo-hydrolase [Synergistaceae bacterium]